MPDTENALKTARFQRAFVYQTPLSIGVAPRSRTKMHPLLKNEQASCTIVCMNVISDTNIFLAVALDEPEKTAKPKKAHSPFDVPGIKIKATTQDILNAVRDSRAE